MDKRVEAGREFWRAVLLAGATAIPRWTLDPAPGFAEHVATRDDDLAAAVRRLADGLEQAVALGGAGRPREGAGGAVRRAGRGDRLRGRPGGLPLPCLLTRDHFFDLGGTSLSAVKPAISLSRAVCLGDIAEPPNLVDMAELLHGKHARELLTSCSRGN